MFSQFAATEIEIHVGAGTLFHIGSFPVTNSMFTQALSLVLLFGAFIYVIRKLNRGKYNRFVGLVQWAFKQVGKNLPRTSQAQAQGGVPVAREALQPGDVVIFYPGATHVGIYAGDGNVLHASTFGVPVAVARLDAMPYNTARRY